MSFEFWANEYFNANFAIAKYCAIAKDPNTSVEELEKLSNMDDWVREIVVESPNASIKILEKLACDKDPYVRESVLENQNTNDEVKEIVKSTNELFKYLK